MGLHSASQRANAALIAQNELEQLRRVGFGSVVASVPPFAQTVIEQTTYETEVEVHPAAMSNGTNMDIEAAKQVRVVVRWQDQNDAKEHSVCAVIFKRI